MGWCRRSSRFILDAFRRYNNSKTTTNSVRSRISQFSSPPPLQRNWGFQNVFKNNTPFHEGAKRFYRMDRNTVQKSKHKRWSQNPRTVIMVSCGAVYTAYFLNLEIVPYTERPHFVLFPSSCEKRYSDLWFEKIKSKYTEKILPPLHPQNIRAQKLAQNLIEAQKELRREPHSVVLPHKLYKEETVMRKTKHRMIDLLRKSVKIRSSMIDSLLGERAADSDGLKWEVIVVKEAIVSAYCLPSGKIVVFSGLLDYFKEDDEVAAIIGHEVGHAVARHHAEKFSRLQGILDLIYYLILYDRGKKSDGYKSDRGKRYQEETDQEMRTLSHRMEMEADYIGLLLMASAGYDPRVASRVWERLRNYGCDSPLKDKLHLLQQYVAIHPCGEERSNLLSHPKLMEEPLSIYTKEEAQRLT